MKRGNVDRAANCGIVLLDAMIAILIFSFGILGMVALQSNAVTYASDARYRTQAAMLADLVIAEMWSADPATMAADYATGGPKFNAWQSLVDGTSGASSYGAQYGLPGGAGTISVDEATGDVVVTITWAPPGGRAPGDLAPHNYISTTQIAR